MREPKTILLTDSRTDGLEDYILGLKDDLATKGWCVESRSCGVTKDIQLGDRVFLLLQGRQHPGVIASGWALGEPYEDAHWGGLEKKAIYVFCSFDCIVNPFQEPHLERKKLLEGVLGSVRWDTPSSGISVKPEDVPLLESTWADLIGKSSSRPEDDDLLDVLQQYVDEFEDEDAYDLPDQVEVNTLRFDRDRSLADQIKEAYDYECQVCCTVIENGLGERYAEAAHVKPLRLGGPDVEENMLCLCPNCHKGLDMGCWYLELDDLQYLEGHVLNPEFVDFYNSNIYVAKDGDETEEEPEA